MKENLKKHIYIITLLSIGFVLRFSSAISHTYSSDELSAITRLRIDGFENILSNSVMKGDMHPAGVQFFEEFWSALFGTSEILLRFPFVLFGVFSIFLTYLIGLRFLNKQGAIIASTLITVTYLPVLHSELARPYSPGLLFVLLVSWNWLNLLFKDSKKWLYSLGLGLSFALAMYTHYFAFMLVGLIGLTGLAFINKKSWLPYISSGILSLLLFIPHINITLYHLSIDGGLQWLGKPNVFWIVDFIFYAINQSYLYIILIVSLFIYSRFNKIRKKDRKQIKFVRIFLFWFFGIYLIGHLFSEFSSPILKYPVMLFAVPFLFLVIGYLFSNINKIAFNIIFISLLFFGSLSTILEKDLYGNEHYGIFKELVEPMIKWRDKYGKENIVNYMNVSNPYYLNYYAIPLGDSLTFKKNVMSFNEDISIREELLIMNENYCIVGYSQRLTLPMVFETCLEFYPKIIDYKRFNNCAVFLLSKEDLNISQRKIIVFSEFNPDLNIQGENKWIFDEEKIKLDSIRNKFYYLSDSTSIYGPDLKFKLKDINTDYDYTLKINVEADLELQGQLTASLTARRNGELVQDNNGNTLWMGHDLESMLIYPKKNKKSYYTLNIPNFIKQNDEIQISLWNRNGRKVKIFSISIELVENIWN